MPKAKKRVAPAIGATFSRNYKGKTYTMTVVKGSGESVAYKVGRNTFSSPSSAAKSITVTDVNGWAWWRID